MIREKCVVTFKFKRVPIFYEPSLLHQFKECKNLLIFAHQYLLITSFKGDLL